MNRKVSLAWHWLLPVVKELDSGRDDPREVLLCLVYFVCGILTGVALAAAWLP